MARITQKTLLDEIKKIHVVIDDRFQFLKEQILDTRSEMRAGFAAVDKRFEQVDKRFEQVDKRFDQMDKRIDKISRDVKVIREQTAHITERVAAVEHRQKEI